MENKLKIQGINSKGFGIIPKLVTTDRSLSLQAKGLYAYFCSYAGAGETCFPTRKKICYDLCISNDSLSKYLKELIENGYISCEQIKENGKFSHNVYTINTKIPCPKISDTENPVYENLDTNNNNNKNNIIYNNNIYSKRDPKNPESENQDLGNHAEENPPQYNTKQSNINTIYNNTTEKKEIEKKNTKKNIHNEYTDVINYVRNKITDKTLQSKVFAVLSARVKADKAVTPEFVKLMLSKLDEYSAGDYQSKLQILDQSIDRGYITVYPLTQIYQKKSYYKAQPQYLDGEQDHLSYDLDAYEEEFKGEKYKEYLEREIENMNKNENKG